MAAFLYDLMYTVPVSFLAVIYTAGFTGAAEPSPLLFLSAFIFSLLFAGLLRVKGWIRAVIVLVLPLQLIVFLLIFKERGERIPYLIAHLDYFWVLLITLFSFAFVKLSARFPWVKAMLAAAFFALLVISMIRKEPVRVFTVALTMTLLLFTAAELIRLYRNGLWKTGADETTRKYLVYLSPFLVLLFPVLMLYKAPEKAYDWDFAKRIYADVATAVDKIQINLFQGSSGSYESATVGFSDDALLSGNVKSTTREVMVVSSNVNQKLQLYLAGKAFNDFDGKYWEADSESEFNESTIDLVESFGSVLRYDPEHISDYLKPRTLHIGYRYFNSAHMFHPLKSETVPELIQEFEVEFVSGNVVADHKIGYDDDYSVSFYRMNRKSTLYNEMLENTSPLSREEWEESVRALGITITDGLSYEEYLGYRDMVFSDYTEAPVLTERTAEFMRKLMDGADTELAKMNRLEAFLQSFDYDSDPGSVPDRIGSPGEYLDYFLFENPRGYCNYFATAMVLLARSEGYPARYVQGYQTTVKKNTVTTIRSDRAHSWAEIYFEGFGWITYEATPGFHIDSSWTVSSEKEGQGEGAGGAPSPDQVVIPDEVIVLPEDLIQEMTENETLPEEETNPGAGLLLVLIVIGVGIAAAVLLLGLVILIRKIHYERLPDEKKLRVMFRRNTTLLSANGLALGPGETLSEFYGRVSDFISSEKMKARLKGSAAETTVSDVLLFLPDYENAVFADTKVTPRMVRNSEQSNRKLISLTGRTRGPLMPFIYLRSIFR